jgi:hypothetical protein
MIKIVYKKVKKKLIEFFKNYKNIKFYNGNQSVILLDLKRSTKVRTYLYLIYRINQSYDKPIIIPFSIFKSIILAKYFGEMDYIYFAKPFKKHHFFKKFSNSKGNHIHISYDYKKVYNSSRFLPNALPYIMHPEHYNFPDLGNLNKAVGIIMSGNFDEKIYNLDIISKNFGINNRWEIYNKILLNQNLIEISGQELINNLDEKIYSDKFVLMKWQSGAIPIQKWRYYLSSAKFLFCAPGMTMPLCHNVIEAMSVGVIPILNYQNWLNPSLENDISCLVYDDLNQIDFVIEKALLLAEEKLLIMQEAVIKYYDLYYKNYNFDNIIDNELIIVNEDIKDLI